MKNGTGMVQDVQLSPEKCPDKVGITAHYSPNEVFDPKRLDTFFEIV